MRFRAIALAVICAVVGAAMITGGATAGHNDGKKHKVKKKKKKQQQKISICHRTGNDSYVLIRVGKPAKKAHLGHGDVFPTNGTCPAPPPQPPKSERFFSDPLDFGPNGWGGWSCPSGYEAIGGGHDLEDVADEGIAKPGATIGGSTYPVFPHHNFAAGETGYVVQNDNDSESGRTIFVDCIPIS